MTAGVFGETPYQATGGAGPGDRCGKIRSTPTRGTCGASHRGVYCLTMSG